MDDSEALTPAQRALFQSLMAQGCASVEAVKIAREQAPVASRETPLPQSRARA